MGSIIFFSMKTNLNDMGCNKNSLRTNLLLHFQEDFSRLSVLDVLLLLYLLHLKTELFVVLFIHDFVKIANSIKMSVSVPEDVS